MTQIRKTRKRRAFPSKPEEFAYYQYTDHLYTLRVRYLTSFPASKIPNTPLLKTQGFQRMGDLAHQHDRSVAEVVIRASWPC
jgi:hypothetical protein